MAAPVPQIQLVLLLLLAPIFPHQTASSYTRQCLNGNDVVLGCLDGEAILVESAFLGVSEGHDPATGNCSKTSDKCHQPTTAIAEHCNRQQTCFVVYPNKTVVNLQTRNGCGLANYIEVTHICVKGSSCQQKLDVEFDGHSTQSCTVCSSSQRVMNRSLFSRASIGNETITPTFDKVLNLSDAGTFVINVNVVGLITIQCSSASDATSNPQPEAKQTGWICDRNRCRNRSGSRCGTVFGYRHIRRDVSKNMPPL